MNRVLVARRRYADIRRNLDMHCEIDRGLHDVLTRTIRSLDLKLAASGDVRPCTSDILAADASPECELSVRAGINRR